MKDKRYTTVSLPAYVFWMLNVTILILPGIKILLYLGMFERGKFNDVLTTIILREMRNG